MSRTAKPIVVGVDGTPASNSALLVVASHTGHWMRQIVLGSTSMHVVRHAHTPVVVIPVTDRESAEATR